MLVEETSFSLLVGAVLLYLIHIWTRPINPPPPPAAVRAVAAAAVVGSNEAESTRKTSAASATATAAAATATAPNGSATTAETGSGGSGGSGGAARCVCTLKLLCGAEGRAVTVVIDASALAAHITIAQLKAIAFPGLIGSSKVVLIYHGQRLDDSSRVDSAPFYKTASAAPTTECILHAFITPIPQTPIETVTISVDAASIKRATAIPHSAASSDAKRPANPTGTGAVAQPIPTPIAAGGSGGGNYYGAGFDAYGFPIVGQTPAQAQAQAQAQAGGHNGFGHHHQMAANAQHVPIGVAAVGQAPQFIAAPAGAGGGGGGGAANVPKPYVTFFAVVLAFLGALWGLYFAAGPKLFGPSSVVMLSLLTGLFLYGARAARILEA